MRRYIYISAIILCFVGCSSYKSMPSVVYRNDIQESIKPMNDYCIYHYFSNIKGIMDEEERIPANYQICFPPKRLIKYYLNLDINRCFFFTKSRGIAIFQDIQDWKRVHTNGFRQISKDSVDSYLSPFGDFKEIKIKEDKNHYLYVDNEIRIVFYNLSQEDYHSFVELPLKSLKIERRGEIRIRKQ